MPIKISSNVIFPVLKYSLATVNSFINLLKA